MDLALIFAAMARLPMISAKLKVLAAGYAKLTELQLERAKTRDPKKFWADIKAICLALSTAPRG